MQISDSTLKKKKPAWKKMPDIPIRVKPDVPSPEWWNGATLPAPKFDMPNKGYRPVPLPAPLEPLREAAPWYRYQTWQPSPIPPSPQGNIPPFKPQDRAERDAERLQGIQDTYRPNVFDPKSWYQVPLWKRTFPPIPKNNRKKIPLAASKPG